VTADNEPRSTLREVAEACFKARRRYRWGINRNLKLRFLSFRYYLQIHHHVNLLDSMNSS